jgi:glutaredoxin
MDIELFIPEPNKDQITVYSKSGCPNCSNVKKLLKEKQVNFIIIDCDDYILEDKAAFLNFIRRLSGKEHNTFPFVFDGTRFIGGYKETFSYLEKLLDFDFELIF